MFDDNDLDISEIDHALQDSKACLSAQKNHVNNDEVEKNSSKDEPVSTSRRYICDVLRNGIMFIPMNPLINIVISERNVYVKCSL